MAIVSPLLACALPLGLALATPRALSAQPTAGRARAGVSVAAGATILLWTHLKEIGPALSVTGALPLTSRLGASATIGFVGAPTADPAMSRQRTWEGAAALRAAPLARSQLRVDLEGGVGARSVRATAEWIDTNGEPARMRIDRRGFFWLAGAAAAWRVRPDAWVDGRIQRTAGRLSSMRVDSRPEPGYAGNLLTTYTATVGVTWTP